MMNVKKTALKAAIVAVVGTSAMTAQMSAHAFTLNNGDQLTIDAGVVTTNPTYGATNVASGSFFGMDTNNPISTISPFEKVAIPGGGTNNGITIGSTSLGGASHLGGTTGGDTGGIDSPWVFNSSTGTDFLTTAVTGDTTNGLDFSGWTVTWNTIPAIPMNSNAWQPSNCAALGCTGLTFTNGTALFDWDGVYGSAYTIRYTATVPVGDPSNFGGTQYYLQLQGTVLEGATTPQIPVPAAVWLFGSGLLGLVGVARRRKTA